MVGTIEDNRVGGLTGGQLIDRGYHLLSGDGEFCLPDNQRTRQNVNQEGLLTLLGAQVFAEDVLKNLDGAYDVRMVYAGAGWDVYAMVRT